MNTMENNRTSCKLKFPKDLDTKTPVFLVNFANSNVNIRCADELKFTCYQQIDSENKISSERRVLVANSEILNYESLSSGKDKDDHKNFNYFVGVRNKGTGRMKIFNSALFHLRPVRNSELQLTTSETKTIRERTVDLAMSFGSKGMKRSITAQKKYSMKSDTLDDALEDISLNDTVVSANRSLTTPDVSSNIDYLPPRNCYVQSVDEVYEVRNIISAVEDEYLDKRAYELLQDLPTHLIRWKVDGTFCEYVVQHLQLKELTHLKVKYLLYFNYLAIFSKLLSSDMKKSDPAPQIPEPLKSCMLDRFTNTSITEYGKLIRSFPQKMKDKLLSYILVLALVIDNYQINLVDIQKGTKFGIPKLMNIAQALGCYVGRRKVDNSLVSVAELKLPLNVVQMSKRF